MLTVIVWIVFYGSMVAVIKVDQNMRATRAAAEGVPDWDNKSVVPYLVIGLICGGLILPVYFYSTRKSGIGALIGLGWTVAVVGAAFLVGFILALAHVR